MRRLLLRLALLGGRLRLGLRLAAVVAVIAEILLDMPVLEHERAVRDLVEEIAVMRDGEERAGERHERLLDGLLRGDVEMVRRLVEHEEIRAREHELEERDARLLAA